MTYQSPGVYIEEVPSGPQPIAAASTSVVAVLGTTRKGPVGVPTRVTSWSDFVRTYGNATERSFTAESVFGFFENGGPAAFIVRVDPSSLASWTVFDAAGAASFTIRAASAGAWANALEISVGIDSDGVSGALVRGTLTGAATVATGTVFNVPLASTAGFRAGDPVAAVAKPTAGPAPAAVTGTVQSVGATSIAVDFGAAVTLPSGSVIASSIPASATVYLPTARGFRAGDVVVVTAPNGARTGAVVTTAVEAGSGMTLTLDSAATAVAGAAFAQRRITVPVTVNNATAPSSVPPSTNVGLNALTFAGRSPKPVNGDLAADAQLRAAARIVFSDGRAAVWAANTFPVPGSATVPSGTATLTYGLFAAPYADSGLALVDFASADLVDAYGWVPNGTVITLTHGGAGAVRRLERGHQYQRMRSR